MPVADLERSKAFFAKLMRGEDDAACARAAVRAATEAVGCPGARPR